MSNQNVIPKKSKVRIEKNYSKDPNSGVWMFSFFKIFFSTQTLLVGLFIVLVFNKRVGFLRNSRLRTVIKAYPSIRTPKVGHVTKSESEPCPQQAV